MVKHDGQLPGFLYVVSEPVTSEDLTCLPDTEQTHWQTQRDLRVECTAALPIDVPPQLTEEEIARQRKRMPEGETGFLATSDE